MSGTEPPEANRLGPPYGVDTAFHPGIIASAGAWTLTWGVDAAEASRISISNDGPCGEVVCGAVVGGVVDVVDVVGGLLEPPAPGLIDGARVPPGGKL